MRLLETTTMNLASFEGKIPTYAILSHTWEIEEVSFQDFTIPNKAREMYGYRKIYGACDLAKKDGHKYIWIDTCCINKESSAELSEAINSMYNWYKNAHICYVYLSDVPSEGNHIDPRSLFAMSRWFTRGWTLQELIAPERVIFYSRDWVDIGTKASLQDTISSVTGISPDIIVGGIILDSVPVAVRMSWAATRDTTREEDIAYSLMGIFNIHMPLLYGEGEKAFFRLQHEIIKKSTDHSIFAWATNSSRSQPILARSPKEFKKSGKVKRILGPLPGFGQRHDSGGLNEILPYTITNRGLHIEFPLAKIPGSKNGETLAFLNCRFSGKSEPITITLQQLHSPQPNTYFRSRDSKSSQSMNISHAKITSIYAATESLPHDHRFETARYVTFVVDLFGHWDREPLISGIGCDKRDNSKHGGNPEGGKRSVFENDDDEAVLVFEDYNLHGGFAVVGGKKGPVWCNILSATDPEDKNEWKALNAYRSSPIKGDLIHWTKKNRFLDRISRNLTNGWRVTVSASNQNRTDIYIKLVGPKQEIQATPQPMLPPPGRGPTTYGPLFPGPSASILLIPPAPEHGYMADVETSGNKWVQSAGCLVSSSSSNKPRMLTFKNDRSGEQFFFLISLPHPKALSRLMYDVRSTVWLKRPTDLKQALKTQGSHLHSYRVHLSLKRTLFVRISKPRDASVADCDVTLSIQEKQGHRSRG